MNLGVSEDFLVEESLETGENGAFRRQSPTWRVSTAVASPGLSSAVTTSKLMRNLGKSMLEAPTTSLKRRTSAFYEALKAQLGPIDIRPLDLAQIISRIINIEDLILVDLLCAAPSAVAARWSRR